MKKIYTSLKVPVTKPLWWTAAHAVSRSPRAQGTNNRPTHSEDHSVSDINGNPLWLDTQMREWNVLDIYIAWNAVWKIRLLMSARAQMFCGLTVTHVTIGTIDAVFTFDGMLSAMFANVVFLSNEWTVLKHNL